MGASFLRKDRAGGLRPMPVPVMALPGAHRLRGRTGGTRCAPAARAASGLFAGDQFVTLIAPQITGHYGFNHWLYWRLLTAAFLVVSAAFLVEGLDALEFRFSFGRTRCFLPRPFFRLAARPRLALERSTVR